MTSMIDDVRAMLAKRLRGGSRPGSDALDRAVVFRADPVARYVESLGGRAFAATDWPTVRPPYDDVWIEWREGERSVGILIDGRVEDGMALDVYTLPRPSPILGIAYVALSDCGVPIPATPERVARWFDASTPIEAARVETEDADRPTSATPYPTVERFVTTALYTLAFLHCKNITVVSHDADEKVQHARERRGKLPLLRYHTLHLHPVGQSVVPSRRSAVHAGGGAPSPLPTASPIHLVRGHFVSYTDTAPLFGKLTGTFWRPAHARGNRERGIVGKEYLVHPPKEG